MGSMAVALLAAAVKRQPGRLESTGVAAARDGVLHSCLLASWQAARHAVQAGIAGCSTRGIASRALRYDLNGQPNEVLRFEELELPPLKPGEVLVHFQAAPINPADLNVIEGKYPLRAQLPAIAGMEGVGVVLETRPEASVPGVLLPGDRVVPLQPLLGTWASAAVLPATSLYRIPGALPILPASSLTINPPTALCLLERFVDLQEGDVVIQNGANSSVGQAVVEVAASKGVHTVNIVRKRDNWDEVAQHLQSLGGTVVTSLEEARVASENLPRPKLGLDCVGGEAATKIAKMLSNGGTMVTYGAMSKQPVTIPPSLLIFKDIRVRGFALSMNSTPEQKRALLDRVVPLAAQGAFSSRRYKEFELQDFREALVFCQQSFRDCKTFFRMDTE